MFFRIVFLLLISCCAALSVSAKEITVTGNQRIETDTIKAFFGNIDINDQSQLNKILKQLYDSKLFSDINLVSSPTELQIMLRESPIINKLEIVGNKSLSDDVITQELQLKERDVYNKSVLIDDVIRITEIYKRSGRVKVEINPKVKILDNNRIDLVLQVKENKKSKISHIIFHNNNKFSNKTLRKEVSSKEKRWYRSSASYYDPDRVEFDKQLLRQFYLNNGYANYKLEKSYVEYLEKLNEFVINYQLAEGEIYYFDEYEIESQYQNLEVKKLYEFITLEKGKKFTLKQIEKSVDNLLAYLNDRGFAFADIEYKINLDHENKTADIKFLVKKNKKVYIRNIKISGNTRTEDQVIRREIRLYEGDAYSDTKLNRSKQRLSNLAFFSSVNVNKNPVPGKNLIDLEFVVAEQPTGELNFGVGYSTAERFLGNVTIRERNLMGKAHSIALSAQKSALSTNLDLSYTIPNFKNREFSLGFDIFSIATEFIESDADVNSIGFSNRIFYEITEYLSQSWNYTYKIDEVLNVDDDASAFIREQEGRISYSAISQTLAYDKRDSNTNPTEGYLVRLSTTWAGLGGQTKLGKVETGAVSYVPFLNKKLILKSSARGGAVEGYDNDDVRINNRFFLGGPSLRGFRISGIGPRDATEDSALGGKYFYKGSFELLFPIGLPEELGFRGSVFSDFGTVTGLDEESVDILDRPSIRVSAGIGISWESPLGPIRFDFARAIRKEDFDRTETFRINFGTRF